MKVSNADGKTSLVKRSVKILWWTFLGGIIFIVTMFTFANYGLFGKMPSIKDLENPEADLASEIYTADGVLMGKYYTENRSEVHYNQISPNVINALIATEDMRFKDHSGIDIKRFMKAVITLGNNGGASTITQQLAKMILHQGTGNFIERSIDKMKEWIIAVKLERNFTKEEIITLYLNRAPWGNVYGIRNASLSFFQKEPLHLSVEEAAVLVGMLRGTIYNPVNHPKAAMDRRNTVLNRMVVCDQHFLTREDAEKYKSKALITNYKRIDENTGIAPHFRDVLKDTLVNWCKSHINPKTGDHWDLFRDGLKIRTTINSTMQRYAEEAVEKHMPVIQLKLNANMRINGNRVWKDHENVIESAMRHSERWKNMLEEEMDTAEIRKSFYVPVKMKVFAWNAAHEKDTVMTPHDSIRYHKQMLQASFVCMDPKSGEIKCWVGGINHKWFKYDHVTAERQVGSAFKPLLYTLAVKDLNYTPASIIPGGSITLSGKTLSGVSTPLANCLANSINYAAFQLINAVGIDRTVAFAHDCGIKVNLQPYPSLALGAAEIPILQLLQAYTMFPGKGLNTTPVFITSIEDKNGNVLETFKTSTKELIGENDAYTMVSMMQGVVQKGTARALNGYGIPVAMAGKTGTTTGNADGWFMGYTPELLAGTWVGCDDPFIQIYKYGTSGGNEMALPNWGAFMKKVYADKRLHYGAINKFPMPADSMKLILQADIDNLIRPDTTGQPNPDSSSKDYFIEEPENNNKPLNNIDTAGFNEKMLRPQNQHP